MPHADMYVVVHNLYGQLLQRNDVDDGSGQDFTQTNIRTYYNYYYTVVEQTFYWKCWRGEKFQTTWQIALDLSLRQFQASAHGISLTNDDAVAVPISRGLKEYSPVVHDETTYPSLTGKRELIYMCMLYTNTHTHAARASVLSTGR